MCCISSIYGCYIMTGDDGANIASLATFDGFDALCLVTLEDFVGCGYKLPQQSAISSFLECRMIYQSIS